MKRALAVSALVLCLVACGEDPKTKQDKNCIDPNTFANICLENALREEERKSSAYLDQKFAKEDKQFEFNKLPVEEQKEQIAQGTAPTQTVVHHHHHHNSGGNGFLTGMLIGHMVSNLTSGPSHAPQTFQPRPVSYAPSRPLGPSPTAKQPSVLFPVVKSVGTAVAAPVKRWFPSNPKPTVQVPVRPIPMPPQNSYTKPAAPIPTQAKPSWFKPKAVETPTVAPKPSWTKPTVAPAPSAPKPSWSAPRVAPTPAPAPKPSWSAPVVRSAPTPSYRPSTPSFRSFGRR